MATAILVKPKVMCIRSIIQDMQRKELHRRITVGYTEDEKEKESVKCCQGGLLDRNKIEGGDQQT